MQHWTSRISLDSWPFWLYKACTCVGGGAPKLLAQSSWHDLWVSLLEGAPKSSPLEDGVILSARTKGTKFQSPAGVGLQKSRFLSPTCPLDLLGLKPPPGCLLKGHYTVAWLPYSPVLYSQLPHCYLLGRLPQ